MSKILSFLIFIALAIGLLGTGISREIPIGGVTGTVMLEESGKPFPNAHVRLVPIKPPNELEEIITTIGGRTDANGAFKIASVPAGSYSVEVYGESHEARNSVVHVIEANTSSVKIKMTPTVKPIELYSSQKTFAPDEPVTMMVTGYAPEKSAVVRAYRVDLSALATGGGLEDIVSPITRASDKGEPIPTDHTALAKETAIDLKDRDSEGVFHQDLSVPGLSEGLYLIEARIGKNANMSYAVVTHSAMIVKSDPRQVVAFVADIKSGTPEAGAKVQVHRNGSIVGSATTDAQGLATIAMPAAGEENEDSDRITTTAQLGNSLCIAQSYVESSDSPYKVFVQTDRPIYRPGDTAHWKATIRRVSDGHYDLATGTAQVKVYSPDDQQIQATNCVLNSHGSIDGSFGMIPDVVGAYRVVVTINGHEDETYVSASAYRKPEFKMSVVPMKEVFVGSEPIRVKATAQYYFGGPVPGSQITGEVYRREVFGYSDEEDEDYEGGSYDGEFVGEVSGVADANGECILTFTPPVDDNKSKFATTSDATYTFRLTGTETGDKYFEAKGSAEYRAGSISVNGSPDRWFMQPGQTAQIDYTVVDIHGKPVPGKAIEVIAGYQRFTKNSVTFEPIQTLSVTTDANGEGKAVLRVDRPGYLVFRASVVDPEGNKVTSESGLDVWSGDPGYASDFEADISIKLDQKSYNPGDRGTALIQVRRTGGSALVTLERENLIEKHVVALTGNAVAVPFTVPTDSVPNFTVKVAAIRNKEVVYAENDVKVERKKRALAVQVTPDTGVLHPGEKAGFSIAVTDESGRPTSAELGVSLVDEAIYAIREDTTDPVKQLYPRVWSRVRTDDSLIRLYLDGGDKEGANLDARQDFRDTAYWNPSITTDADGKAHVEVNLPDNLTQWRLTALAIDDTTRAGIGRGRVIARKELMVRLSPPQYVVQGDQIRMTATVNNATGKPMSVALRLTTEGLVVEGESTQTVKTDGTNPERVTWMVRGDRARTVSATIAATGDAYRDAMKLDFPVLPAGVKKVESAASIVTEATPMTHVFEVKKGSESVELALSAPTTLAGPILESLSSLVDDPYGCVEQTMNRFMPAMVASKAGDLLGLHDTAWQQRLPQVTAKSMNRLKQMQHADGGWGWWQYDDSDREMTALVLEGLVRARSAGVPVPENMVKRARSFTENALSQPYLKNEDLYARAYLAYAAAVQGWPIAGPALDQLERQTLGVPEAMHVALAREARGELTADRWSAILAKSRTSGGLRSWSDDAKWPRVSTNELTARGFELLSKARPDAPETAECLQYLMNNRSRDGWNTTRETAAILVGLVQYMRATHELTAAPTVDLIVNGRAMPDPQPGQPLRLTMDDLQEGKNTVEVQVRGAGRAYAQATLSQFVGGRKLAAASSLAGFSIERSFHRLSSERGNDGKYALVPVKNGDTSFTSGDVVRMLVNVDAPIDMTYMLIKVPVPANFRAIELADFDSWNYWYSGIEIHDDHVAFFARNLPRGRQTFEFNLRAETPGKAIALPAEVSGMYVPSIQCTGESTEMEVRPK